MMNLAVELLCDQDIGFDFFVLIVNRSSTSIYQQSHYITVYFLVQTLHKI